MRTAKLWASATALVLTTIFWAQPAAAVSANAELTATALHPHPTTEAVSARTQVVMAGMVAALAALLLLKRSPRED